MALSNQPNDWVSRLCNWLGRRTFLAPFLDWVASWLMPQPAWHSPPPRDPVPDSTTANAKQADILHMAAGPYTNRSGNPFWRERAPTSPHAGHDDDRAPGFFSWLYHLITGGDHTRKKNTARRQGHDGCEDPKYRGMHGTPCRFAGGTDLKCPAGTVSGWFWTFETPVGRIYYVDCCGGTPPPSAIFCNWTNEPNWCVGYGRATNSGISQYNCTLAIPDSQMRTVDLGGGRLEVDGVDP